MAGVGTIGLSSHCKKAVHCLFRPYFDSKKKAFRIRKGTSKLLMGKLSAKGTTYAPLFSL